MRIFATIFVILILTYLVNASVLDPVIENVVHLKASKPPNSAAGIWKKKTIWKPRWVKEWKSAKVMKPVWRKVWSPVQIREWVPIPKPPPGWDSISTPLIPIHPKPQNAVKPVKDSIRQGSYTVPSAKVPLWDPVPYPESQQPPPLLFLQGLHNTDASCGKGECDSSPSQTFNHQQISEIIGTRYQTPEYFQSPEFSETVNHLTRLPPDGNNWRPPQPLPDFRFDNNFQGLSEFLVPPKFQSLPQITPKPPTFESVRQWIPLPPENKIKGHFITKAVDPPFKFQQPEVEVKVEKNKNKENLKERPQNDKIHPQANRDFIEEAQLVGEYHYSTFDVSNIKPQTIVDDKEPVKVKLQQTTAETHKLQLGMNQEREQKPKTNQSVLENQQTSEIKQPEIHTAPHIQKKHITNQTNSNYYIQQDAVLKEIIQKQNLNPDPRFASKNLFLTNHSTTKLRPIEQNSNSTRPQSPIFIPPNHRFSTLSEIKHQILNHNSTENILKPEKNNTVQIVFATTPVDYNESTENLQKSTTTESYELIFSSSLQATTEAATRSPVVIVTPANFKENP